MVRHPLWQGGFLLALSACLVCVAGPASGNDDYAAAVLADHPAAYWPLSESDGQQVKAAVSDPAGRTLLGALRQGGSLGNPGVLCDDQAKTARYAAKLNGSGARIVVADPGGKSVLDFAAGDSITLEAWVNPARVGEGQQVYIIGKGRTGNRGFAAENQNYALRLRGQGGTARLSFLFRSADNRPGRPDDFHRWNSDAGFVPGSGWHYVAVSYKFGDPGSIRGYIDGYPTAGAWDYGGPTDEGPVVDDDALWIGSAMGGSPGSSFTGSISDVALYRHAVDPQRIMAHYEIFRPAPPLEEKALPEGAVLVEIFEGIPDATSWSFRLPQSVESYTEPAFALVGVRNKYSDKALLVDRTNPFLVRATGLVDLPKGPVRLLLRARGAARLFVDGRLVVETPFPHGRSDGHETVHETASNLAPHIRPLPAGDQERTVSIVGDGQSHRLRLEVQVGGKKRRPELGETLVAIARDDADFRILGPKVDVPLTDAGWEPFAEARRTYLTQLDTEARRKAGPAEVQYWKHRHDMARREIAALHALAIPEAVDKASVYDAIDRFIGAKLQEAGVAPRALCDDWTFLRRATLDLVGTIPTPQQTESYFADPPAKRRALLVDRLLEEPGWADHWTGYWQDVLAENPNILNPTLNNTGPFRTWIHESFVDNKPMDRFATELVLMEGSKYFGGPGGFELATQNDAPMAAKAHIIAQGFVAADMKCARCHDSPNHPYTQKDLFGLAAMLGRKPQQVPKTSTVQRTPEELARLAIEFSVKPGEQIPPVWPLEDVAPGELPPGVLRNADDTRERLAAVITSPRNRRFAQVLANRLWRRLIGWGLMEPVDDWEYAEGPHAELLDYLARELAAGDYDLKRLARRIMTSHVYQRDPVDPGAERADLFAGPVRRRMTAEQVVDSLLVASGKSMGAEELNLDVDGSRPYTSSLNLGVPCRAWQFTSLSNERDRPSLSLPGAQSVLDVLTTFGWRGARQDPLTVRPPEPTVLQPAILANGVMSRRMVRLSDDGALVELALADEPVGKLVDRVFVRLLTRPPTSEERAMFVDALREGYENRRVEGAALTHRQRLAAAGVSWSNHLSAEANRLKIEQERQVREGDPPTARLNTGWRERMEDMVWVLMNSPEFVFVP